MSMNKAIESGKEHRKQYRGCKAFDPSCRCHGECPWCRDNRMHRTEKRMPVDDNGDFVGKRPQPYDEDSDEIVNSANFLVDEVKES